MRALPPALAAAVLIGLFACDQKHEATITHQSNAAGEISTYTVKGPNGATAQLNIGSGTTANLPSYLPLYPGATVQSSMNGSSATGAGGTVAFTTSAAPSDVIAFYKQKSTAAGMAETLSATSGTTATFGAADRATKKGLQVVVTKTAGGSQVQIFWSGG